MKAESAAASDPKRATVYNKPEVAVRKTEAIRWLAALFLLIILLAGAFFYSRNSKAVATFGLPVAVVVGAGVLYWVKAVGDKADANSRRALDARRGAAAEEAVGDLMSELPAGCFVVHDTVTGRGNIDHIVITKKGILTVETKSHNGVVSCEGEMLKRDGQPFEKDLIKQAWAQAFSVRDLLAGHGITVPKPQPVLLFANADVQVRRQVRGVEILGRRDLPAYLKRIHTCMATNDAERIFEVLKLSQSQMFV